MKRRLFLQLLALPALLWPRARLAQPLELPMYSDNLGTVDLSVLHDNDLTTGILYGP